MADRKGLSSAENVQIVQTGAVMVGVINRSRNQALHVSPRETSHKLKGGLGGAGNSAQTTPPSANVKMSHKIPSFRSPQTKAKRKRRHRNLNIYPKEIEVNGEVVS